MKKRSIAIILGMAVLAVSCKKEKDESPAFSAVGYWSGTVYVYSSVIVNNADGTTRLYLQVPNADTAATAIRLDGTYTVSGNDINAVYPAAGSPLQLKATRTSSNSIAGTLWNIDLPGAALPFELYKMGIR